MTEVTETSEVVLEGAVPEGWLPELWNNRFTRALGLPPSLSERIALLDVPAAHAESERGLSHDQRKYAVLRLFEVSVPIERQVSLVERMHMIIRQGYKARDPSLGWHRAAYLASAAGIERFMGARSGRGTARRVANPDADADVVAEVAEAVAATRPAIVGIGASGMALIGDPGMGKTTVKDRVAASFPPTVIPDTPYRVVQIPCLRVEAPSKGGRRQFCLNAFAEIDRLLKTDYSATFGVNSRAGADHMMLMLQHLATLHAIGLIIVDEFQHLLQSTEGPRPLVNFLVTMVNLLGVPVMLIGTNEARSILSGAFREARRAAGLGQPNWERLRRGEEWDDWLEEMWRYQWTAAPTALTPEISEAIYDESQGIIDIAVKLLILAQMRAISKGETSPEEGEVLDPDLYHLIAKEEFGLVAPMIAALRDGRVDVLQNIPDLMSLNDHVESLLERTLGMPASEFRRLRDLRARIAEAEDTVGTAHLGGLKAGLIQRGHSIKVVERVVAEAVAANAVDDIFGITEMVADLLKAEKAPRAKAAAKPRRKSERKVPADGIEAAVAGAADPAAALREAGIAKTVDEAIGE